MKHTKKEPLSRPYMVDTLKGGREGGGREEELFYRPCMVDALKGRCAQSITSPTTKKKRTKRKKTMQLSLSPHYYSILRYTTYTTLVPQTLSS